MIFLFKVFMYYYNPLYGDFGGNSLSKYWSSMDLLILGFFLEKSIDIKQSMIFPKFYP